MILRAMAAGFVIWLAAMAVFRFFGELIFSPVEQSRMLVFGAAVVIMAVLTFICLRILVRSPGDEAEASIGLAFPGMALGAFVVHEFPRVLPNMDPTLDGAFGALLLAANAAVIFTGVFFTRLSPQDEKL